MKYIKITPELFKDMKYEVKVQLEPYIIEESNERCEMDYCQNCQIEYCVFHCGHNCSL